MNVENKISKPRKVDTNGTRNENKLTLAQETEAVSYAIRIGMKAENIRVSEAMNTSYSNQFDMDILYIGTDVLPRIDGIKANSRLSMYAALAHEIIGHREAELSGNTNSCDTLEEAQASIRAARFAPDLQLTERILLLRDAIERLHNKGLKIRDCKHLLWINER